jgi:hypothetical protein
LKKMEFLVLAALTAFVAQPSYAKNVPSAKIGGVIDAVNGNEIDITATDGAKVVVMTDDKTRFVATVNTPIDAIAPGSYIGTAAMSDATGNLKAMEVTVFPESMRGLGEGSRPYDQGPQSSMTNGTVGSVVGTNNRTITVKYNGGQKTVTLPENVPVVTMSPGDKSLAVAGAKVVVRGRKGDDGKIIAMFVTVGKDGSTPPL